MTTTVTATTARAVLALYAEVYTARTGSPMPTGLAASRSGTGPVLMVPDAMDDAADNDKVYACDTTGNGHPAVVLEGETGYCRCCYEIAGCWTHAVQEAADNKNLGVFLEPYAGWAVSVFPA